MAMIRSAIARDMARDAVVLDLGDLARQGRRIVEQARQEADRIVREAREERRRLIETASKEGWEEGRREGHASGLEEGREEGRAEALQSRSADLERVQQVWLEALESFVNSRQQILEEARIDILRLAVAIAERVTKRAVELDASIVIAQIDEILSLVTDPTRLTIRISPDDRHTVDEVFGGLLIACGQGRHARIIEDSELSRGSCIADIEGGAQIDSTIETQLDRIIQAVLPVTGSKQGEAQSRQPRIRRSGEAA